MKYLTEKEFEKEMTQIKQQKRQYEMKKELREAKRRFPKFKKPRTSKMVLWTVIAICIQILWFTEHMASSKPSYSWSEITSKPSTFTPASHTHDDRYYTETEINTKLGAKLGAVSANGYYGMARPDGNTSDWIRTTTVGIIPYQSGGAGGGHCGLGTSSWYFSNAYIDTVNCVNASVSGHIDVGGYIQSSKLINTYFEYQSNRGSVDWRFGAATGTGDENFFGFYDAKTGKIPLALDGNYGNIYVTSLITLQIIY